MRVPDFFIVGHAKCGTTALYEMLRQHPQIYMPKLKEPLYFATDLRARLPSGTEQLPTDLDSYLALFEGASRDQLAGEASSSYLWSREAADEIARVAPKAKIIGILREPASFLRSLHLQLRQSHIEDVRDFGKALALEAQRKEGKRIPRRSPRPQALMYSQRVRYVEQLRRYGEVFPPEQRLILIYDDFRAHNDETVRRVLRFLGVDDTVPIARTEANPTVRVRSQRLAEVLNSLSVGRRPWSRAVKGVAKVATPASLRRRALRVTFDTVVFGGPDEPDERQMTEIRRRYRGEVEALSEWLGRDLVALWGYDRLG